MTRTQLLALFGLTCVISQQVVMAQLHYQYQDLGSGAAAYAINDDGLVVGSRYNSQNKQLAVVWDRQGSSNFLSDLWGSGSTAFAINQNGQIAGQAWNLGLIPQAVAWSSGSITTLATQTSQPSSQAVGINGQGLVAGNTTSSFGGTSQAVVWQGLNVTPLNNAGGTSSFATSLNDAGLVTGYVDGISGTYNSQAVIWQGNTFRLLPNLISDYSFSIARAVNKAGVVVGQANTGSSGYIRAVVWRNNEVTALPAIGDVDMAQDINDLGVVVGTKDYSGGSHRASLWDTNTGLSGDLNILVGPGVLPANITLIEANAINNLGDIVGTSYNSSTGNYGAFALRSVPENSTLIMWVMGIVGLVFARMRNRH